MDEFSNHALIWLEICRLGLCISTLWNEIVLRDQQAREVLPVTQLVIHTLLHGVKHGEKTIAVVRT